MLDYRLEFIDEPIGISSVISRGYSALKPILASVCLIVYSTMESYHILTLFFLTVATICSAERWTALHSKFAALDLLRLQSFYEMPRTMADAIDQKWTKPGETIHQQHLTTLCRKSDPSICLLYDDQGSIAAYQMSIPRVVDSLIMPGIDYETKSFKPTTLYGQHLYSITVYFESQVSIRQGGRRLEGKTATGVWLPIKGKLVEIPRKEKDLQSYIPEFIKQNCYNKMGVHYFYNISLSLEPQYYQPLFLLYSKGDLVGFGLNAFGSDAVTKPFKDYIPFVKSRNWFETVPSFGVRKVAPDTPDWSMKYLSDYGVFSHHVYLVPKPWDIECD